MPVEYLGVSFCIVVIGPSPAVSICYAPVGLVPVVFAAGCVCCMCRHRRRLWFPGASGVRGPFGRWLNLALHCRLVVAAGVEGGGLHRFHAGGSAPLVYQAIGFGH